MVEEFYKINIEKKLPFMQQEHEKILRYLYKNAVEKHCIENYSFSNSFMQNENIKELFAEIKMDKSVLTTCLDDLQSLGFIYNTNGELKSRDHDSFALSLLGLKYIEQMDEKSR